ncbi:Transcriptional regulator, AbiEi antitoxin, Type IV TA system [Parafrankia irregularis]|uniref:Transcriptional regulator, AbiEi antitoxin, Type IV TA system n=1 Tax=Parafrankia irregularis TaxID=795642 RepID=A0A0S4QXJ8_9ACTN|nr:MULTISPECIES: hypothetical protein [Parafrankia]MBE3202596.1 hypothetical protein [Parafrankia sp. CH37]CUU59855.1 Transcriptional regulator, AbiEi antitoxin, Type IV TA system [Parafrankia irregularis]
MPDAYAHVVALARRQDDMVTRCEARRLGMSDAAIASRRRTGGWWAPIRGTLLVPPVRDRVRAYARAALAAAGGVVCLLTAARLHGVPGLPPWQAAEPVDVAFEDPAVAVRRRRGCRRHLMTLAPPEVTDLGGITVTAVHRTLQDVVLWLDRAIAVPMLRAVLRHGWLREAGGHPPRAAVPVGESRPGAEPSPHFVALKDAVLRRHDSGAGPGGGPEFWRLVQAGMAEPGDAGRADQVHRPGRGDGEISRSTSGRGSSERSSADDPAWSCQPGP